MNAGSASSCDLTDRVTSDYYDAMSSDEHLAGLDRIDVETQQNGSGILEAMCRAAGPANWDRPLEALEMYSEARRFMDDEIADLIREMRTHYEPPFSWDQVAQRLGISRQSAWAKFRMDEEDVARLRQRPGPRQDGDVVGFIFHVNQSFLNSRLASPITIPTSFNDQLDERMPGDGPSWHLTVVSPLGRGSGRLRRSQTGGTRYYQLTFSPAVRQLVIGPAKPGERLRVRIPLLGHLSAELSPETPGA